MLTNTNKKFLFRKSAGYAIVWFLGISAGLLREYLSDDVVYISASFLLGCAAYILHCDILGEPEA